MRQAFRQCAAVLALIGCAGITRGGVTPDGEATQVRSARAGDVYRGAIVVRNTSAAATQVKLFQTDYAFSAQGQNWFDEPGTLARSNARWLKLNREQIAVEPRSVATVEYEVRVPEMPALAGTFWSVVIVEELPAAEAGARRQPGMRLSQTIRHAIQIITEIGDSGRSDLVFRNARVLGAGPHREFDVDLENTGERWLRTDVWLELHDAGGHFIGRFHGDRQRTFPGTSVRNRIDLASAPTGRYVGLLVADGGRNDLFGMQIELDLR